MTFSIIVPIHNAAEYMRRGLDSIRWQSYKDYELIIVCDACTDDSEAIAREYTDKVYSVDFGNEGKARNYGLDHASGDWILWMDDDDWWLHQFAFDQLAMMVSKHFDQMDVLAFAFIFQHWGYAAPLGNRGHYWIAVWNKVWKRDFIGDTRFGEEFPADVGFHTRMMQKLPRIVNWDMPLYYYNYMRPGSQTWKLKEEVQKNAGS